MTTIVDITQLNGGVNGTIKSTDIYPAVDTTDTSQAATGTTKRYSIAQLQSFIVSATGVTWNSVSGITQAMVNGNGYVPTNVLLTTFTLPVTIPFGERLRISGLGLGGWIIANNAGQLVHMGNTATTTGIAGSIASTNRYDSIELLCVVANLEFVALSSIGNLTIT